MRKGLRDVHTFGTLCPVFAVFCKGTTVTVYQERVSRAGVSSVETQIRQSVLAETSLAYLELFGKLEPCTGQRQPQAITRSEANAHTPCLNDEDLDPERWVPPQRHIYVREGIIPAADHDIIGLTMVEDSESLPSVIIDEVVLVACTGVEG